MSGNLQAFRRVERTWLGSMEIAIRRAGTGRYSGMPTGNLGALSQPGRPLHNIEAPKDGLITFPGSVSGQELADVC